MRKIIKYIPRLFVFLSLLSASSFANSKEPAVVAGGVEVPLYKASYALVIGVSSYRYWPRLPNIEREARDVATVLDRQGFKVRYLTDPTGEVLQRAFRDFFADFGSEPDGRLIVYFAGHGHSIGENGYLVPIDAPDPGVDLSGFLKKAQSMNALASASREYRARHALYVFDSCFSGAIFSTRARESYSKSNIGDLTRYLLGPAAFSVRQFITAGTETQRVPEVSQFTPLFLRAIEGQVEELNNNGFVSAKDLGLWLSRQLALYSSNQTPRSGTLLDSRFDRGDFVFSVPVESGRSFKRSVEQLGPTSSPSAGSADRGGKGEGCFYFNEKVFCE